MTKEDICFYHPMLCGLMEQRTSRMQLKVFPENSCGEFLRF